MTVAMTAVKAQGSNIGVYRLVGSLAIQLGNLAGTAETWPTRGLGRPANHETEYRGERWMWIGNEIRKFDGTNWPVQHTLSPGMDTSHTGCHTGLWVANVNNVPVLIGLYSNVTNNQTYYINWDGTTWTEGSLAVGDSLVAPPRDFLWNNVLYVMGAWTNGFKAGHLSYDPLTNSYAVINSNTGTDQTIRVGAYHDAVVFNNKLFKLCFSADGTQGPSVYQLIGGAYQRASTFDASASIPENKCGPALFVDNGSMYAFYYYERSSGHTGWHMHRLDSTGAIIADVTSSVVPLIYQETHFAIPGTAAVAYVFTDQTSGTLINYIIMAPDFTAGQSYTLYQFNGPSTVMSVVGSGVLGDVAMVPPHSKTGGGNRLYRSGQLSLDELSLVKTSGGIQISFKAYGGTQANIQFYFSTDGGPATTLCSLSTPSAGTISGSNLLQDINCDGTTTYTVTWVWQLDGVSFDSYVSVVGKVFN